MKRHNCGGAAHTHASPDPAAEPRDYLYCDCCGAFSYGGGGGTLPSGTDRLLNQAAWNAGEDASPEAQPVEGGF